jgi:hypothetical protein
MTFQKDPDTQTGMTGPRGNYVRHADGSWNILPLVLGALAVVVVGYMFLSDRFNTAPDSTSTTIERPVPKTN